MDKLRIVGGRRLNGEISISGAKNAALPILCAALLTSEPVTLRNVPQLNDISTTVRLLADLGVKVTQEAGGVVHLQADQITNLEASYELVKTMRASILVLGPLLTRFGQAKVSLPGGCSIGQRPVDQHIKGLTALGADITVEHGFVVANAVRLKGAPIVTDMVTVGGTEQFLMAAALAEGQTVLENAAREPEVVDLAEMLISMGARISGHGTDRIVIDGVERLHGTDYTVVPDRIEAGSFLCAVGATGGDIMLRNAAPDTMGATLDKLIDAGLTIESGADWIRASMQTRPKAVGFRTREYPGFPTDMQAQLLALNTVATGMAVVVENIFENRYMHVPELMRMGADIELDGHTAVINGVQQLMGAQVMATDLRASASLVIAGLAATGETIIDRIYHLDRGYEKMEDKLQAVGADIQRLRS
ncbi:UDP-N-acetylglucosamine 1-carboxyvinyltransferase [Advenella mimigardefordensis]|uniref:UDP-N-acetylglucosamine 1-carboxyvinyltransferase n=1 Tax=Advenella mimigardefordensis (strain DSM 17166 / LMG 22922 / DPN7) TaxID=1247726 RepID=W0PAZ3_ADVMD|nr:UDP-N-acetylglucosamine 1-carboxyvinyltransferase [Advenella mimigardefordensis]AHG62585.1 UDP-N-acetylglucosamine 1-carboxyvinyltransferase [Advenella mimigardefordensis DPN7]